MNYEEYEKLTNEQLIINKRYLELFESDLTAKGLSDKTIYAHLSNVDFYLNEYLLRTDIIPMEKGMDYVDDYLGYFFIRKCMWSTPSSIQSNSASLKKFYKCMLDHDLILKEDYTHLINTIKDNIDQWKEDCAIYNDPDCPNPFLFS